MNWQGFGLVIIALLFAAGQVVVNRWIKKVTNCYFFWLAIGILCFVWLMVFRFGSDMSRYWSLVRNGGITNPGSYTNSNIISRGLFLDTCPLCGLLMSLTIMVDPTRKAAKLVSPISFVAGLITLLSFAWDTDAKFTAQYIFFGSKGNECYYIMHFMQLTLALGVMLNTPRYTWKGWVGSVITCLLMYTYVGICKSITGARWFVSGLDYNDWRPSYEALEGYYGQYHFVAEIFHWNYKVCPYIGIPFLIMCGSGTIALKDYVLDRQIYKYGNAYSGIWYKWYNYNKFVKQVWF